mmetsp:Transcript_57974/g.168145  ORF Transcript_57974/g.168145 Transcript_57974/m.168145 type:complete len:266 (+) Transcript_57974:236-1033(+)
MAATSATECTADQGIRHERPMAGPRGVSRDHHMAPRQANMARTTTTWTNHTDSPLVNNCTMPACSFSPSSASPSSLRAGARWASPSSLAPDRRRCRGFGSPCRRFNVRDDCWPLSTSAALCGCWCCLAPGNSTTESASAKETRRASPKAAAVWPDGGGVDGTTGGGGNAPSAPPAAPGPRTTAPHGTRRACGGRGGNEDFDVPEDCRVPGGLGRAGDCDCHRSQLWTSCAMARSKTQHLCEGGERESRKATKRRSSSMKEPCSTT